MRDNLRVVRAHYDFARTHLIDTGKWVVEPDEGRIWSQRKRDYLSPDYAGNGYARISVYRVGRLLHLCLHRVIWEYVHGPIPDGLEVNHKDGDTTRNEIANLELLTRLGNVRHSIETGLRPSAYNASKLTEVAVVEIRRLYDEAELTTREIGRRYGISGRHVCEVGLRRTWRHVPEVEQTASSV